MNPFPSSTPDCVEFVIFDSEASSAGSVPPARLHCPVFADSNTICCYYTTLVSSAVPETSVNEVLVRLIVPAPSFLVQHRSLRSNTGNQIISSIAFNEHPCLTSNDIQVSKVLSPLVLAWVVVAGRSYRRYELLCYSGRGEDRVQRWINSC